MAPTPAPSAQVSAAQYNAAARSAILAKGVDMLQQIYGQAINPANQSVINVQPQPVGLVKGFFIELIGTIQNTGTATTTLTPFGAANAIKSVQYNDLNNNVRVQTTGWHLALLDAARQGFGFGGNYNPNLPLGMGNANNYAIQTSGATIANAANTPFRFTWYLPLAYAADDFRGAIYSAVTSATQNIQITLNTAPGTLLGDPTQFVYAGGATTAATWLGNIQVNIYQSYMDQLPRNEQNAVILPITDLATIYEIKNTTVTGMVANSEYGIPYANYRDFLSTFVTYDQNGTLNPGTDINYWAIQAANLTNFKKISPGIAALLARQTFMGDLPGGTYYFDHRKKPLNTIIWGNTQLVLNASSAAAQSSVLVGYEAFAYSQALVQAQSLPAQ